MITYLNQKGSNEGVMKKPVNRSCGTKTIGSISMAIFGSETEHPRVTARAIQDIAHAYSTIIKSKKFMFIPIIVYEIAPFNFVWKKKKLLLNHINRYNSRKHFTKELTCNKH